MSPELNNSQEPDQTAATGEETILSKSTGLPFKAENAARAAIINGGFDPNQYQVVQVEGGWAIQTKGVRQAIKPAGISLSGPGKNGKEQYLRGVFIDRTDPNETEGVVLGVNGEVLHMQRNKAVCLPERFWKCAECTRRKKITRMPGEEPQTTEVMTYPFSITGVGTEKEFRDMKVTGTLVTRQRATASARA